MKRIKKQSSFLFLLGILFMGSLCLTSCHNESAEMTAQEKETAKKEISAMQKKLMEDGEKMNIEASLKPYLNTPDFLSVGHDGSSSNYEQMKKQMTESTKNMAGYKVSTIKEEFRFLNKNEVLYTWFGKVEATSKTGEKRKTEVYANTMILNKINNEWRIVYEHYSMAPLVAVN